MQEWKTFTNDMTRTSSDISWSGSPTICTHWLPLTILGQVCQLDESVSLSESYFESYQWYFPSQIWQMHSFSWQIQLFAAGLLLSYKLCMFLLLDYFHPGNYAFVLREAPRLSMCRHSNERNPLTEHVQSVYWACAEHNNEVKSSDSTVLIDNYDSNFTQSETQTHWVNSLS